MTAPTVPAGFTDANFPEFWKVQDLANFTYAMIQNYGVTGPTGSAGPTGPTGPAGATGATGPTGP